TGPDGSRLAKWAPRAVERAALRHAQRCVYTTPGAAASYAQRYPERRNKLVVIPNGYDERNFSSLSHSNTSPRSLASGVITLVHSGLLYPGGRNPHHFFIALAMLVDRGLVKASLVQVILRASGHEKEYAEEIKQYGLGQI